MTMRMMRVDEDDDDDFGVTGAMTLESQASRRDIAR